METITDILNQDIGASYIGQFLFYHEDHKL